MDTCFVSINYCINYSTFTFQFVQHIVYIICMDSTIQCVGYTHPYNTTSPIHTQVAQELCLQDPNRFVSCALIATTPGGLMVIPPPRGGFILGTVLSR